MRIRMDRFVPVLAVGLLALAGCAPDDPSAPPRVAGQIPPARVAAIGNSLTAGYLNDGLIAAGQQASYANLVARRVTGRDMTMPLFDFPGLAGSPDPDTGLPRGTAFVTPQGGLAYRDLPAGNPPDVVQGLLLASGLPVPYDNMGVPGAFTSDLLQATSSANSVRPGNAFYDLILRNSGLPPGDTTQLDQFEALVENGLPQTGVLLFWIGSNDVLIGGLSGDPVAGENITPTTVYADLIDTIFARIDALGVPQTAVLNIPDITVIPFVTSIAASLAQQSLSPAALNTDEENVVYVLLSAQTVLFEPDGSIDLDYVAGASATPESLPSQLTLTQAEVALLQDTVAGYNAHLANAVDEPGRGWALVDVNTLLSDLSPDPTAQPLNRAFPLVPVPDVGIVQNTSTVFSLDGVHPAEKGHARVANAVIDALNATYGTQYPQVDESAVENTIGFEEFGGASGRVVMPETAADDVFRAMARSAAPVGSR